MNLADLFEARNATNHDGVTTVSKAVTDYIEQQLRLDHPFSEPDDRSDALAKERAEPMARLFDGNLTPNERGIPFTPPFLWGKVVIANARDRKILLRGLRALANTGYSRRLFTCRFFYRLDDVEEHLGGPVDIRQQQRQWLAMPSEYYLVLVENHSNAVPYHHHVYAFDAKDHQHYMTIFLDDRRSGNGGLIYLSDMKPEQPQH